VEAGGDAQDRFTTIKSVYEIGLPNAQVSLFNRLCYSSCIRGVRVHLYLSTQDGTTAKQLISNRYFLGNGRAFVTFHPFIEDDRVLFCTRTLPISANDGHFLGLASGKIDVRGDILET